MDWYYYNDGPFLGRCLDEGLLKAKNVDKIKFALMWANHDWKDIFPYRLDGREAKLLYPGDVTPATFEKITDLLIHHYFKHPSYWKVEGAPYFSIYDLPLLMKGLGGFEATKRALDNFRKKAKAAGFPDIHLNIIAKDFQLIPGETAMKDPGNLMKALGVASATSYVWLHDTYLGSQPTVDYSDVRDRIIPVWYKRADEFPVPYYPNVSMGWDTSPRVDQDIPNDQYKGPDFISVIDNNDPGNFKKSLMEAKKYLNSVPAKDRILTINSWNEWTEGSHLEPDAIYGMKYLEAIKEVFPR
jgi:hypothetical protein